MQFEEESRVQGRFNRKKGKIGTAQWVAQRLEDSPEMAIGILMAWLHPRKIREINDTLIAKLWSLMDDEVVQALNSLSTPKQYIRGQKGKNQLDIKLMASTIDDQRSFCLEALIDCGSTGSCVDKQFVEENNLTTKRLPMPIPVYNADRSANTNGPITEVLEIYIWIQDHMERIELAVSNLDKSEIFLGMDWWNTTHPLTGKRKKSSLIDAY